ncbi:MAG: hypothetical protein IAE77_27090 [Prosthecobacter sp.]|uniref:hypothetical protein n=1 Tax=Prosthecobacter sp. TaxID=1965333 RepID=UPI001A0C5708|nr:hypothetical protein [Prosthecobacter sp.]MBE2287150.1 hypothetical protein [Prosthecobacter sp.]
MQNFFTNILNAVFPAHWRFVCILFMGLAPVGLSAQHPRGQAFESSGNEDGGLAADVARPYGQYQYMPQKGLYRDVTFGDVAEDFRQLVGGVYGSIDNLNRYTSWSMFSTLGDFTYLTKAGVGGFALPGIGVSWGSPYDHGSGDFRMYAGPLLLDNFYAGFGAIYSDINGSFPGIQNLPPDDRWAYIVWLSFRATLILGDSLALSLQPYIYWLPNEGRVGWALPGPMGGMMLPNFATSALLQVAWTKDIGNWKFVVYDQFTPFIYPYNIWDVFVNATVSWGDLSPIDRVGRYGVGYGSGNVSSYDPTARFRTRNDGWDGLAGYYNIAGARASAQLGLSTQSLLYFDRVDVWDRDFKSIYAGITGGAYIRSGAPTFLAYAGYNFASAEPYDSFLHWSVAGVRKQLTSYLAGYVEAGYYWTTGNNAGYEGWTALIGIQQRLGYRTYQMAEIGRRVYKPIAAIPGLEDYAEYRVTHQLGARTNLLGFAGVSERHSDALVEGDQVIKYAGLMTTTKITSRINNFASAGWERIEIESNSLIMDRWTYRLGLMYAVTQTVQSQCFYQYEDVHTNLTTNYSEHYLYLGISKRF